jgi:hypothetical protein
LTRREGKLPTLKPPEHMNKIIARFLGVVFWSIVNISE